MAMKAKHLSDIFLDNLHVLQTELVILILNVQYLVNMFSHYSLIKMKSLDLPLNKYIVLSQLYCFNLQYLIFR